VADTDSDGDGTPNCTDGCPFDPLKLAPGVCGCGVADTDTDGDGAPDCEDLCPGDPTKTAPSACGCGVADTDTDGDGTPDCADTCLDADHDGYGVGTGCAGSDPDDSDPNVPGGGGPVRPVSAPARMPWYILRIDTTEGGKISEPVWGVPYLGYYHFSYYAGTVLNLRAVPDAGYRFVNWTGDVDTIADVNAASTTITMNRDYIIMANFAKTPGTPEIGQHNLTISSTAGGSVTSPGEGTFAYNASTVVDLVAKADSGYRFVNWTGNVTTIANVNGASTTITMNGDYSIMANFAQIPPGQVVLTISSSERGSVTTPGEGTFTYDEGKVVNLEAEPDESCRFIRWTGDVDDIADVNSASTTITMKDNYSVTATFRFGTGCFIATAAYGTPMAEEIQILRDFRDECLLTNAVGETLVELYYTVSPPIAEFITEHPSLKPVVRAGLFPAVAMSTVAVNTSPAEKAAIVGSLVLFSVALAIWLARRRDKGPQYV
jgi:hypothetical protein